jgi:hypothetical protein
MAMVILLFPILGFFCQLFIKCMEHTRAVFFPTATKNEGRIGETENKKEDLENKRKEKVWDLGDLPVFKHGPNTDETLITGVENVDFKRGAGLIWYRSLRVLKLMATFGSTLFNVIFIIYEFAIMPDRFPGVPLDLARKLVVAGEFSNVLMMILQLFICSLIIMHHDSKDLRVKHFFVQHRYNNGVDTAVDAIKSLQMSSFSLIMFASPDHATKFWTRSTGLDDNSTFKEATILFIVTYCFNVGFGFLAVAAKLSQFSFLSTLEYKDWTPIQWFSFLAMGNQLAGLGSYTLRCVVLPNMHTKQSVSIPAPLLLPLTPLQRAHHSSLYFKSHHNTLPVTRSMTSSRSLRRTLPICTPSARSKAIRNINTVSTCVGASSASSSNIMDFAAYSGCSPWTATTGQISCCTLSPFRNPSHER